LHYSKALLEKPFQTFYYFLKNHFEKVESQNINLHLPKTYANSYAKEILTKGFISNKVCYAKGKFEHKFQKTIFIKFIP
jgi:hypothetical protein